MMIVKRHYSVYWLRIAQQMPKHLGRNGWKSFGNAPFDWSLAKRSKINEDLDKCASNDSVKQP